MDTKTTGKELVALWLEYEDCSSPEARIVKDFDKCVQRINHLSKSSLHPTPCLF